MTRPLRVELVPAALAEAQEARRWYAARSPEAADRFMAELDRVVGMIAESPTRWPEYRGSARRVRLRRFPYFAIYRIQPEMVLIVAIAHHRRKPGYWQRRL